MPKELKTARELVDMIKHELTGFTDIASVGVHRSEDGKSWFPVVVVWGTEQAGPAQAAAERAAERLRIDFDLFPE